MRRAGCPRGLRGGDQRLPASPPDAEAIVSAPDRIRAAVATVADDEIPDAIGELERAKAALWARLTAPKPNGAPSPGAADEYLTPTETAKRLKASTRWVYRHARELGGVRFSPRCLRFPAGAVERHASRRRI